MKRQAITIKKWSVAVIATAFLMQGCSKGSGDNGAFDAQQARIDSLELANEQLRLENDLQSINNEFDLYENQAIQLQNDTIYAKYTAAKNKIEQLKKELNATKGDLNASRKKIEDLKSEIETLRGLLRHYVAQIDSLNKENEGLRAENTEIKNRNEELNSRVQDATRKNEVLNERMTLAEKMNVAGNISLTGLKKNGKAEKNITKATQLMVTFTITQNNSTPVGEKTIYMRITSPEGQLLGGAGSFPFEGGNVQYTAKKTIEYSGEEIPGIKMYWDVNSTLNPGTYTVELFADNYRLISRQFTMNK